MLGYISRVPTIRTLATEITSKQYVIELKKIKQIINMFEIKVFKIII